MNSPRDKQLEALAVRLHQMELAMFHLLKQEGMMEKLQKGVTQLGHQIKCALGPDAKVSIPAISATLILKLSNLSMERMNLLRFQELAQKEKDNEVKNKQPTLKLSE